MRGLYPGRFQPFHIGHVRVVASILDLFPFVSLNIGVADWQGSLNKSLFLKGIEAKSVVDATLSDTGISLGVLQVPISPGESLETTIARFVKQQDIQIIFSGSDTTLEACGRLVREGLKLTVVRIIDKEEGIRGTNLRRMILEGSSEWRRYMTKSAANILESFNPRQRLIDLSDGIKRPWVERS